MSTYKISHSTELMQNYRQADVMGPQEKFIALQTNAGASLLFSISTAAEKILYVTKDVAGSGNGWARQDLRDDQLKKAFPTGGCKDFAAAQHVHESTATIQLALVMDDGTQDHLYLSLGNSDTDTSWTDTPKWNSCPFNASGSSSRPFKIANLFISEAKDENHIVVDLLREPESADPLISRYFIDVSNPASPVWKQHDVDGELEAKGCKTCLGRRKPAGHREEADPSDGLYTSGVVSGRSQFTYKPLRSPFGDPKSARLALTADASPPAPDAIAACRKPDSTSDLYAAHGGCLYLFASNNQFQEAVAVKVLENPLFIEVKDLFASITKGVVTVWGRNANYDVFHTSCPLEEVQTQSSWSLPLPIMTGVQNLSPYVNKANSAKTFFAHTGANEMKVAVKSPRKNGTWKLHDVHLPRTKLKPLPPFKSYTTHVKVIGPNNSPLQGRKVRISAENITRVSANHLSYVVGPTPIDVTPDPLGGVTIVEEISRLDATQFTVSVVGDDGSSRGVNPMHGASTVTKRLRTLQTADGLVGQTIHYQNEKVKPPRYLVREGKRKASDPDVKAAAENVKYLWTRHDELSPQQQTGHGTPGGGPRRSIVALPADREAAYQAFLAGKTPVLADGGDILRMLDTRMEHTALLRSRGVALGSGESLWEAFVQLLEGIWHFVVKIGEAIFAFVIEVVEDVFAAFKYVFNKIVEAIEDILEFVEFLFELEDIRRTKNVLQHVSALFLKDQVSYVATIRHEFDDWIKSVIAEIDAWAKEGALASLRPKTEPIGRLQSAAQPPPASASDSFFAHHFSKNAQDAYPTSEIGQPPEGSSALLADLWALLKEEIDTLHKAVSDLYALSQNFEDKTPEEVVKRVIDILATAFLKSLKAVIDALLKILERLADWAVSVFTSEAVYIPIVSEILEGFGVPEFTVSDVVWWTAAIPLTIGYKLATGSAPFPDSEPLMKATDFQSVVKLLSATPSNRLNLDVAGSVKGKDSPRHAASASFHLISSALAGVLAVLGTLEALAYKNGASVLPPFRRIVTGISVADNVSRFIALSVVPRAPFHDPEVRNSAMAIRCLTLIQKLSFGAASGLTEGNLGTAVGLGGALTDGLLVLSQAAFILKHFAEIGTHPPVNENDKNLAIVDEVSNLFTAIARVSRDVLILDSVDPIDPEVKVAIAATFATARGLQMLFQFSEGVAEFSLEWPA